MALRQATIADSDQCVALIRLAIGDLAEKYIGFQKTHQISEALRSLFETNTSRFYYENIYLIEEEDKIIGQVTIYPADEMLTMNQDFLPFLESAKDENVFLTDDYIKEVLESKEADDGEFYIDSLAVFPEYQGNGYGKTLLEYAERVALLKGFGKVSLLADIHNDKAIYIYEQMGYQKTETRSLLGHEFYKMIKTVI